MQVTKHAYPLLQRRPSANACESIGTIMRTRKLLWSGALLRMGDHRLPERVVSRDLEKAGKRGPVGKKKEWTDCVAEDLRLFGITGDWNTAALHPGAWHSTVREGGCRFMVARVKRRPNTDRGREKWTRRTRLRLRLG